MMFLIENIACAYKINTAVETAALIFIAVITELLTGRYFTLKRKKNRGINN